MSSPPESCGAAQKTETDESVAVAETDVGFPGGANGITEFVVVASDFPAPLVAVTSKV